MPKLQGSVHYIYHSLLYLMNINCFKKWLSSGLVGWLYNKSSLVWLFNAKIYLGGTQKRNWTHSSFVMVIQSSLMSHYSMPRYPFLLADLIFFLDWLGNIGQYLFCKRFFFLLSLLWWSRFKWTVIFFLSFISELYDNKIYNWQLSPKFHCYFILAYYICGVTNNYTHFQNLIILIKLWCMCHCEMIVQLFLYL